MVFALIRKVVHGAREFCCCYCLRFISIAKVLCECVCWLIGFESRQNGQKKAIALQNQSKLYIAIAAVRCDQL